MLVRLTAMILVIGMVGLPCRATVIGQSLETPTAGSVQAVDAEADSETEGLSGFSMTMPEWTAPRRGVDKLFSVPNVAVVLTGIAWFALARRRLAQPSTRRR